MFGWRLSKQISFHLKNPLQWIYCMEFVLFMHLSPIENRYSQKNLLLFQQMSLCSALYLTRKKKQNIQSRTRQKKKSWQIFKERISRIGKKTMHEDSFAAYSIFSAIRKLFLIAFKDYWMLWKYRAFCMMCSFELQENACVVEKSDRDRERNRVHLFFISCSCWFFFQLSSESVRCSALYCIVLYCWFAFLFIVVFTFIII